MHLTILGHGNVAISIILDALWNLYGQECTAEIVKNQPLTNSREESAPYAVPGLQAKVLEHEEWTPDTQNHLVGAFQPVAKQKIRQWFQNHYGVEDKAYTTLIHPSSVIARTSRAELGTIIGPASVVAPYSQIGTFCSINRNVSIGHHTIVGSLSTINPGANIAGFVKIGQSVLVGMGANVLEGVEIGDNTIVGAGSLVTKSLPPNVVAYGSPAKVVRPR